MVQPRYSFLEEKDGKKTPYAFSPESFSEAFIREYSDKIKNYDLTKDKELQVVLDAFYVHVGFRKRFAVLEVFRKGEL